MPVVRIGHVTISGTPVSEANVDFPTTEVSATDARHAYAIGLMTIRTIPIILTDLLCAADTIAGHEHQKLPE